MDRKLYVYFFKRRNILGFCCCFVYVYVFYFIFFFVSVFVLLVVYSTITAAPRMAGGSEKRLAYAARDKLTCVCVRERERVGGK